MIKSSLPGLVLCLPLVAGMFLSGESCNESKSSKMNQPVAQKKLNGMWGGQGISMEVTDTGASLDFDCATGSITEAIAPDRAGKFTVKGLLARQRPGPTREGEENDGEPATYSGVINGENLTLTITLAQSNEKVGTFTLGHGKPARIRKCG